MKVLFIGGNFPIEQVNSFFLKTKGDFQFAANNFQWNLLNGLKENLKKDLFILSAPFINPFPKGYKNVFYNGFKKNNNENYVKFNNIWGFRNFSRYKNLKKQAKSFLKIKDPEKYILVYSSHVPFLKTACYLKSKDKNIKIILVLPDLPQFISLRDDVSFIYKILKPFDIKQFYKYEVQFDGFILLTEQMNELVNKKQKKYIVVEGIANKSYLNNTKKVFEDVKKHKKIITYTGTLHKKFGICKLLDAFSLIEDENYILNICGAGDAEENVIDYANKDKRIKYWGQVNTNKVKELQKASNVLINPRQNSDEFTKYSFPSKNLEYLSTKIPVVAYKLDGIPSEYDDILFYPKGESDEKLMKKLIETAEMSSIKRNIYEKKIQNFLESKSINAISKKIIDFIKEV